MGKEEGIVDDDNFMYSESHVDHRTMRSTMCSVPSSYGTFDDYSIFGISHFSTGNNLPCTELSDSCTELIV